MAKPVEFVPPTAVPMRGSVATAATASPGAGPAVAKAMVAISKAKAKSSVIDYGSSQEERYRNWSQGQPRRQYEDAIK